MAIANANIVTGQRPTYNPSSCSPGVEAENHKQMEYKKLRNASSIG